VQPFVKTGIGKPEQWLIEAGAAIGLYFSGFVHETTNQFRDHVLNRHGDPATHGAATVTDGDFSRIPGIIHAPDMEIIGAKRKKALYIAYVKVDAGITYFYFE
jgi:O-acetyl-ADP-ribose deacetylase (regulator of RNase III)